MSPVSASRPIRLPLTRAGEFAAAASVTMRRRWALYPGRHLGEQELRQAQDEQDRRARQLLAAGPTGIARGLEVTCNRSPSGSPRITINPGEGIAPDGAAFSLTMPISLSWDAVRPATVQSGLYLVAVRQTERESLPVVNAWRRTEIDPTQDTRRDWVPSVSLLPLPATRLLEQATNPDQIANAVCASLLERDVITEALRAQIVPDGESMGLALALASLKDGDLEWVDTWAVRRPLARSPLPTALLWQFHQKVADLQMSHPQARGETDAAWAERLATAIESSFVALPAAGRLPEVLVGARIESMLTALQERAPGDTGPVAMPFPFLGKAMIATELLPMRASDAEAAVRAEFARAPIYLSGHADRVRLLVTVPDRDYRPDLLDRPSRDIQLLDRLYGKYIEAHQAWVAWRKAFDPLYTLGAAPVSNSPETPTVTLTAADLASLGSDVFAEPEEPIQLFARLVAQERVERGLDETSPLPVPYNDPIPEPFESVAHWLAHHGMRGLEIVPPASTRGRIVDRALLAKVIEVMRAQIDEESAKLQRSRDFLLLQRQQLDVQTMNLAALAGGVAVDGSGLRLTRWLPFVTMEDDGQQTSATAPAPGPGGRPDGTVPVTAPGPGGRPDGSVPSRASGTNGRSFSNSLAPRFSFSMGDEAFAVIKEQQPVSPPKFREKTEDFGVIGHVRPDVYSISSAFADLEHLASHAKQSGILVDLDLGESDFAPPTSAQPVAGEANDPGAIYKKLFELGKHLVGVVSKTELARKNLEQRLLNLTKALKQKEQQLASLDAEIARLRGAFKAALERLAGATAEHSMAQRLVAEDWSSIERVQEERLRLLKNPKGLFFIRSRDLPIATELADPLSLRTEAATDVVPGCAVNVVPVPEYLDAFMDAVQEVPFGDFRVLAPLTRQLPVAPRLDAMYERRQARVSVLAKAQAVDTAGLMARPAALLGTLAQNGFSSLSARSVAAPMNTSLSALHDHAAQILGLADVIGGPTSELRAEAQALHRRLEQAAACLVALLEKVPATVRLRWAEDEGLPLEQPLRWPTLAEVERRDLNLARSLVEMVGWWFLQLVDAPSSAGRTVMRNLVRAAIVGAAHGDPAKLVQGRVLSVPGIFRVGEMVRIELNRQAARGTELQLLDRAHRLVGTLVVDDADGTAAVARVTGTYARVQVDTQFTVLAAGKAR